MTKLLMTTLAMAVLLLAGCQDHAIEEKLAKARTDLALAEAEGKTQRELAEKLSRDLDKARGDLGATNSRLAEAQQAADAAAAKTDTSELVALRKQMKDLEAEALRLQGELATARAAQRPVTEQPAEKPAEKPAVKPADPETVKQAEELLGKVRTNPANYDTVEELVEVLRKVDAATREKAVNELKAIVAAEPQNKEARLALASLMVTRFGDLRNPMDQGKLAGDIKAELDKALEIDPDYYYAQHFMAIMKSHYPPFTDEFKTAKKDLDKALDMQSKMTWDDTFCEVYAAYAEWYLKQSKPEEAAAKVQAGLDKDPRNEELLAVKKKIDEAKTAKDTPKEG